ncbi:MAG: DUF929 family protein [Candidatus Micrarchaeia archaeon]
MENEKAMIKKEGNEIDTLESTVKTLKIVTYASLLIGIIAVVAAMYALLGARTVAPATTTVQTTIPNATFSGYNINGTLITPPMSISSDPVITAQQPFGSRLTNINEPLNATELAIINNAPNSYFEKAGEMYLNGSLTDEVGASPTTVPMFVVNGKPSVIYLGSITCLFCSENRWAMAMALSRFGNFSALFKGYSSFGDADLPTLYWAPAHYNQSTIDLGSFYNSKYINFIALEDTGPITGGFALQPIPTMQQEISSAGNKVYSDAMNYIIQLNNFQGTPYTIWGKYNVGGADAVVLGNTTPTSASSLPMTYMTHDQILQQLSNPSSQFGWSEYAAADLYVAMVCQSINNSAPVCSLPAIKQIEAKGA